MSKPKFQSPAGMHDILPEDQPYYDAVAAAAKEVFSFYDFKKIDTPILESAEIFYKGVGQCTDIVEKEMYAFRARGGKDILALRPEGTASIVRAYIQHGFQSLPQPVKLWYFGPFFRHERPQAGRFRQFWQFGGEILGEKDALADAQLISILCGIFEELKLGNVIVRINSIGDDACRPAYKKWLYRFLKSKKLSLCKDCQKRAKTNPLRVLDCKNEKCIELLKEAPQMIDSLCEDCRGHLKEVLEYLEELKIPYVLDPFLVRGLDYYSKTVFEVEPADAGEERQGSLSGGGRYDNLAKMLGGGNIPACGVAGGVERIIALMKAKNFKPRQPSTPQIFLAQIGPLAKKRSLAIIDELRKANIKIAESFSKDSLKSQLGRANKLNIQNVIIIGQKEALQGLAILRNMETGKQSEIKQEEIVKEIKKSLKEN
ncbi:MAG: histidine--tRNA ligase [Candidatus Pacebacteria bacterium]|nr:histidine--tRNA ligase [Candidatus Paceibacterota bacterium]